MPLSNAVHVIFRTLSSDFSLRRLAMELSLQNAVLSGHLLDRRRPLLLQQVEHRFLDGSLEGRLAEVDVLA